MREVITLNIGQAGTQIGQSILNQLQLEHGISDNGEVFFPDSKKAPSDPLILPSLNLSEDTDYQSFFRLLRSGKVKTRSIYFDSEPFLIDQFRKASTMSLFEPDQLQTLTHYQTSKVLSESFRYNEMVLNRLRESVRRQFVQCNNPQGVVINHALGSSNNIIMIELMNFIHENKPKIPIVTHSILPSSFMATSPIESTNALLSVHEMLKLDYDTMFTMIDNSSLFAICENLLKVPYPSYKDINTLFAAYFSNFSSPFRFQGGSKTSLNEICTHLIPYQKLRLVGASFSPFIGSKSYSHFNPSVDDVLKTILKNQNSMTFNGADDTNDFTISRYFSYRGDISPDLEGGVNKTEEGLGDIKIKSRNISKIGTVDKPVRLNAVMSELLGDIPRCVSMTVNTEQIIKPLKHMNEQVKKNRSSLFYHHYVKEGIEDIEQRLIESSGLTELIKNYVNYKK